jgi:hypothetical protein
MRGLKPKKTASTIRGETHSHVQQPFGRWGETFGDATVAAATIDRLVHHAEVINLKRASYRLNNRPRKILGWSTPAAVLAPYLKC